MASGHRGHCNCSIRAMSIAKALASVVVFTAAAVGQNGVYSAMPQSQTVRRQPPASQICERFQGNWVVDIHDPRGFAKYKRQKWTVGPLSGNACTIKAFQLEPVGAPLNYQFWVIYAPGSPLRFTWRSASASNRSQDQARNEFDGAGQVTGSTMKLKGRNGEGHDVDITATHTR